MDQDPLLTVEDVAALLKARPTTVREWIRRGLLKAYMPGGRRLGYRVRASEVQRFLAEGGGRGNAAA